MPTPPATPPAATTTGGTTAPGVTTPPTAGTPTTTPGRITKLRNYINSSPRLKKFLWYSTLVIGLTGAGYITGTYRPHERLFDEPVYVIGGDLNRWTIADQEGEFGDPNKNPTAELCIKRGDNGKESVTLYHLAKTAKDGVSEHEGAEIDRDKLEALVEDGTLKTVFLSELEKGIREKLVPIPHQDAPRTFLLKYIEGRNVVRKGFYVLGKTDYVDPKEGVIKEDFKLVELDEATILKNGGRKVKDKIRVSD